MGIGPTIATWDEWGSVYHSLEAWRDVIHEILSLEGILYHTIEKGYPGTSAVFLIDQKYVIKIYPGIFINDHKREWPVLQLLEKLDGHPLLITSGYFTDDAMNWPYAILHYIDGKALREVAACLNKHEKQMFNKQLARKLHEIHLLPFETLKVVSAYQWTVSDCDVHNQIAKLCLLPFFDREDFKKDLKEFILWNKPLLEELPVVFVHGDLTKDHLYFKKENGEWCLNDIIDWGDAHIAPVYYDLVVLWADVFSNQTKEWQIFLQLFNQENELLGQDFQKLFTVMLFLHPFAKDLIQNAYNNRDLFEQPKNFHTVSSFTQWIFSE